ncbi:unnamed protein product [Lactuca saligna]|uniref:Coatomer subunit zeta n=1 Tax=Lactuca saligna TaxID=75948 RepID=A0AA35Y787_LACSI|nr:unnamed protein product [Lactuca saligna]
MHDSVNAFMKTYFASYLHLDELDLTGLRHLYCGSDTKGNLPEGNTSSVGTSSSPHDELDLTGLRHLCRGSDNEGNPLEGKTSSDGPSSSPPGTKFEQCLTKLVNNDSYMLCRVLRLKEFLPLIGESFGLRVRAHELGVRHFFESLAFWPESSCPRARSSPFLRVIGESCPSVKNILLLDSEGGRIAVKYYSDDWPTNNAKEAFEKSIFTKTQKTNARTEAEIAMLENNVIVYKFAQDLHFFVTGGDDENELILSTVLQGFFDAVGLLLRGTVDKKEALENLDLIMLCLDEIIDGGIILETDANVIAGKVASHSVDSGAPLSEQTISQALATAREHLTRSLLSG